MCRMHFSPGAFDAAGNFGIGGGLQLDGRLFLLFSRTRWPGIPRFRSQMSLTKKTELIPLEKITLHNSRSRKTPAVTDIP